MQQNPVIIKDTTANPAPLGLLAFGMTTVLLNLHNAGLFPLSVMIIAMGTFYGGASQILVGYMEWKKNNTFGMVAFTSYGFFWLTLVAIWVMPRIKSEGTPLADPITLPSLVAYLVMWGIFTAFLFIGTFKMSRALQFVFGSLVVLFFLLAIGDAMENALIKQIAGVEGIVCGASAIYTGMAQILNEVYGKTVMPLGVKQAKPVSSDAVQIGLPTAGAKA